MSDNGSFSSRSFATRRADYFARKDVEEVKGEMSSGDGAKTTLGGKEPPQRVAEQRSPSQQE